MSTIHRNQLCTITHDDTRFTSSRGLIILILNHWSVHHLKTLIRHHEVITYEQVTSSILMTYNMVLTSPINCSKHRLNTQKLGSRDVISFIHNVCKRINDILQKTFKPSINQTSEGKRYLRSCVLYCCRHVENI